jgi:hypothetical protein
MARNWRSAEITTNLIETVGVFVSEGVIAEEVIYKLWRPHVGRFLPARS